MTQITQVSALGRVRIAVEASFGTSETGSLGNFIDLPCQEGSVQMAALQEHLDPAVIQQHVHDWHNSDLVLGLKSSTLNFTTHLPGSGAPSTGAPASLFTNIATCPTKRLLQTLMGGSVSGSLQAGAALALAGSTASNLIVTAGYGTGLAPAGSGVAVLINGKYEARQVLSSDSTNIVPNIAFSDAPAANAPLLFATAYHMIAGTTANMASLQAIVEGAEAMDQWMAAGLQGTFGIDVTSGQLAKLTVQLKGAGWERIGNEPLGTSSDSVGYMPVVNMDSELIIGTGVITACTTRNLVQHSTAQWLPSFQVLPITSPNGQHSSNIVGWKRARGRAVTGNFIAYNDLASTTWLALDQAKTKFPICQQIGSTASGFVLISAPTAQVNLAPVRTDASGLYGQTISWVATNNKNTIAPATECAKSAFVIYIF